MIYYYYLKKICLWLYKLGSHRPPSASSHSSTFSRAAVGSTITDPENLTDYEQDNYNVSHSFNALSIEQVIYFYFYFLFPQS